MTDNTASYDRSEHEHDSAVSQPAEVLIADSKGQDQKGEEMDGWRGQAARAELTRTG